VGAGEGMKEYLFTITVLILILVIIVTGGIAICFAPAAKPDIYITRTDSYRMIDGLLLCPLFIWLAKQVKEALEK
jgi:hypothetical protein